MSATWGSSSLATFRVTYCIFTLFSVNTNGPHIFVFSFVISVVMLCIYIKCVVRMIICINVERIVFCVIF